MKHKKLFSVIIALAVFSGIAVLDGRYGLGTTEYTLPCPGLPDGFDGFRISLITDLHGSTFGKGNSRLISAVKAQNADVVLIGGDVATSYTQLPAAESLLSGLSEQSIYYVLGNHEWAGGIQRDTDALMAKYGAVKLDNSYITLSRDGSSLILAGAQDPNGWADAASPEEFISALREEQPDSFAILLGHRNYWVRKYPSLPVDVILCGHAHGGIVRLPFIGGLLDTNHSLGASFENGLYSGVRYTMVVSRGLGNSIIVPRLFNRPELVTVVLKKA